MELADIMALVKAGYTKDEIAQMDKPNHADPDPVPVQQPVVQTEPTPVQVVEPVAQPVAQPVPQPQPQPVQQEAQPQPSMADLMQSIAKLTSAVQANAIAQSVIPGGAQPQTPTAEDMIAEIIRPTFKARE